MIILDLAVTVAGSNFVDFSCVIYG